ncbi:hypothetical protein K4F52_006466 [Lecanicillium sp. MT-2017a]|nr:hypothetical protein K4F52_006466 [Lecanicillium sp. MT-2017a]
MATSNSVITLRRHDLDNLRTGLTGLVVFHHTAIAYGGVGDGTRARLVPFTARMPSMPLASFNAYNQSFFMGLFFWLSGYFSAQSLARHDKAGGSRWAFVRDKAKRLALPAVVYTLTIMPAQKAMVLPEWTADSVRTCLVTHFRTLRGVQGATWYLATLFIFDVAAACILPSQEHFSEEKKSKKKSEKNCLYENLGRYAWIPVSAASFFIRIKFPVGKTTRPLGLQLAYASQYIFAYSMGYFSVSKGQQWLSGPFTPGVEPRGGGNGGGWNTSAAAYAVWNEISFSIIGPAIMVHFYKWYNKATESTLWKPRYSYATFLIHDFVIVAVQTALDAALVGSGKAPQWVSSELWKAVGPVFMTVVAGAFNSVVSFTVAKALIDNVSWLRKFI